MALATRQEFGVRIDDEEVTRLVTVGDLVAWVASYSAARGGMTARDLGVWAFPAS